MKQKDLTTPEDREILSKPPPPSLIFCRLLRRNMYSKSETTKDVFDPTYQGYAKCKKCPDSLECCRYIEAELHREGIPIVQYEPSKKEKKYYRRLCDERDRKTSLLR